MKESLQELRVELAAELRDNILHYWTTRMVDEVRGGFFGRRDGHDKLEEDADKGVILNTRILWTFSHAARLFSAEYRPFADRAYAYLERYFIDREHGGVYWMVDSEGNPVNTKKQIYAQAFAIYAFSEYYMLSNEAAAREQAIALFNLIERYSFDKAYNGYLEAFDESWLILDDLRLSEKDANEKKTMNTHLHILEAYTNLYRCWPDPELKKQIVNLVEVFLERIIKGKHFGLFFDEKWNVRGDVVSYGHDIEGSWLLYEAAEVVHNEKLLSRVRQVSLDMVDAVTGEGIDSNGAVMNENHDPDIHWWPQAEALVGFFNAYQLTGRNEYLESMQRVWNFIKAKMIDRVNGEWYWRVDPSGNVCFDEDKAGPWKCPYHNSRALLELLKRLPA